MLESDSESYDAQLQSDRTCITRCEAHIIADETGSRSRSPRDPNLPLASRVNDSS
jgi:hypothetical protein